MEKQYRDKIDKLSRENHKLREKLFNQRIDNFDSKVFHVLTTVSISIAVTIATYFALTK